MRVFASCLAASTNLRFFIASMARSLKPDCRLPESSPEPRSDRSSSASSKPFAAFFIACRRFDAAALLVSGKIKHYGW